MDEEIKELKKYQITLLFSPLLEPEKIQELVRKIKSWIEEKKTKIEKESKLIKKKLAQPIKKYQEAFYLDLDFQLNGAEIPKIQKQLNLEKEIIRYMLIEKEKEGKATAPRLKFVPEFKFSAIPEKEKMMAEKFDLKEDQKSQIIEKTEQKAKIEEIDKKLEEILNE